MPARRAASASRPPSRTVRAQRTSSPRAPICGSHDVPPGVRFRLIEIRCSEAFLERIGAGTLLAQASSSHPLHLVSRDEVWIGTAPTAPAIAAAARSLMDSHFDGALPASDLTVEARTLAILDEALAVLRGKHRAAPMGADARRLGAARDRMLAEPARAWTIRELGRRVGLNDKKLKSGFRTRYGVSVHQFLLRTRLEVARAMLAGGAVNVTEASLAVGYSNPSHLARLFRREFGLSPSQYAAAGSPADV